MSTWLEVSMATIFWQARFAKCLFLLFSNKHTVQPLLSASAIKDTSHLRGCPFEKKSRTRASFKKPLASYISLESLITADFCKNISLGKFSFTKRQEPVQTETTETCLIELIRYRTPRQEWNNCTVLFTRHQSTKRCQGFSIFRLVI